MNSFDTPIAFFIFKRPAETARVFQTIKKARPKTLLIVADGPRNKEEEILCSEARTIVEKIDWPCNVQKNYSETNLGCKIRISSGLDWVFQNVEQTIILEDDCLPDQSFFMFCQELLEKYKDNQKIMHISGLNINPNEKAKESYYFSNIAQIWGWATWRRAWQKYDVHMKDWLETREEWEFKKVFPNKITYNYWKYVFDRMYNNELDTWDVAWTYTCFKEKGLCIVPKINLIKNIGSTNNATHKSSDLSNIPTSSLAFPLTHPQNVSVNKQADIFTYKRVFGIDNNFKNQIKYFIKEKLPFMFKYIKLLMKK